MSPQPLSNDQFKRRYEFFPIFAIKGALCTKTSLGSVRSLIHVDALIPPHLKQCLFESEDPKVLKNI